MKRRFAACAAFVATTLASAESAAAPEIKVSMACAGAQHCFESLGGAFAKANRDAGTEWTTIRVGPGSYHEKVTISRNKISLIGSSLARTKLHFDAVAQPSRAYHRERWGTPGSVTLAIDASDVIVSGLTIANDYAHLANDALPDGDKTKIGNPQAGALLVDIRSDRQLGRG